MKISYDIKISSNETEIVKIDRFVVNENKITFLFGESGIGKSMISKAIYGLLDEERLDITINNKTFPGYKRTEHARQIKENSFFVFQEPSSHFNPLMKLVNQINEGDLSYSLTREEIFDVLWKTSNKNEYQKILEVYPKPYRPSGGEKQRLLAAMAFIKIDKYLREKVNKPTFFVFDEPSGNLDNYYRDILIDMIMDRFEKKPFTLLFITHDYSIISKVENDYKKLLKHVFYEELYREKGKLLIRDFKPIVYTNWINDENKRGKIQTEKHRILSVKSEVEIFGRSLFISSDKNGKDKSDLILNENEMIYIKAPSGVGKTTLIKIMMGLIKPDKFSMKLLDYDIDEKTGVEFYRKNIWGKTMTMVFQHADESLNLNSSVRDVFNALPGDSFDDNDISRFLGELFAMKIDSSFLDKKVRTLSGGQKQRINILRSMYLNTKVLILDEPINGMDFESIKRVIAMLERKQNDQKGIIIISHNEEIFDAVIPQRNVYYLHAEEINRL
ncbi:MAG: ATP-binding cassette domain-containing protein [Melioribacteraceae bacterium]|nr:ATP-binding cassette domain-containing protein [Melioribacteraceae bacterium]MCF8355927.1 ATP-binding cassette domain-containing protein [Melioribacteraceae bacterium]MCF8395467.1 ATP-binding cassette domain-containing protein [Melioribacteraceae bacterium]MCF8420779.1 ATP-binding cassette domain-containing protein [Melioribacteraceae bacterium]